MGRTPSQTLHDTRCAVAVALCAAVLAVGCTQKAKPNLALACQLAKCTCIPANPGLFDSQKGKEPLWRPNGDAYCVKGRVLRRVRE